MCATINTIIVTLSARSRVVTSMMKFQIGDIVVLTNEFMRDWCPDERLAPIKEEFNEDTRPECDIGVILSKSKHPSNRELYIYRIFWFPANKIYSDHDNRLRLISRIDEFGNNLVN